MEIILLFYRFVYQLQLLNLVCKEPTSYYLKFKSAYHEDSFFAFLKTIEDVAIWIIILFCVLFLTFYVNDFQNVREF